MQQANLSLVICFGNYFLQKNLLKQQEKQGGESVEIFQPVSLSTLQTVLKCAFSYEDDIQAEGYETDLRYGT